MHSSLNRLQTAFGFFTSCAFTLAAVIAFLSIVPIPTPSSAPAATLIPRNVQVVKGRPHYYSPKREEYASIKFDLDADLSSLFTWNTKQLFVYVTANYPSSSKGKDGVEQSESVIWDMIIPATSTPYSLQNLKNLYYPDKKLSKKAKTKSSAKSRKSSTAEKASDSKDLAKPGVISLKNQKPKYQITDPSGIMSEKSNVTLQLSWNIQPWVGALVWDKGFLGDRVGKWQAGKVGRSEPFNLPSIKPKTAEAVKDPDGPRTPKEGQASPVVDI